MRGLEPFIQGHGLIQYPVRMGFEPFRVSPHPSPRWGGPLSLKTPSFAMLSLRFAASSASPTSCQFDLLTQILGCSRPHGRARRSQTVRSRETRVHRRTGLTIKYACPLSEETRVLVLTRKRQRLVSLSRRSESLPPPYPLVGTSFRLITSQDFVGGMGGRAAGHQESRARSLIRLYWFWTGLTDSGQSRGQVQERSPEHGRLKRTKVVRAVGAFASNFTKDQFMHLFSAADAIGL
jgi:hypothetical protein